MSLDANSRWALTGTPIQNKIKDVHTLFRFVGFGPDYILTNFKELQEKHFLRRTKADLATYNENLKLPELISKKEILDFSSKSEEEFYNKIKPKIMNWHASRLHHKKREITTFPWVQKMEPQIMKWQSFIYAIWWVGTPLPFKMKDSFVSSSLNGQAR